jgi:D-alanine-D-alanine ligase
MLGLETRPAQAAAASAQAADMALLEERIERLKSRVRVAVVFGGNKSAADSVVYRSHNTRSWKSYEVVAQDIAAALGRLGFQHVELIPDDMRLGDRLRRQGIHMAWLNTGGVQGYNPAAHAPAMLEMMGVPYIGHDPLAATTLDIKHAFKRAAVCAGIPTAPFIVWNMTRGPVRPDLNSRFKRAFGDYSGPFVVKPVSGRASLHVHVVPDVAGLPEVIAEVHRATEDVVLIEQFLSGREFCIAVAGPINAPGGRLVRGARPLTFAALERVLTPGERIFTSMDKRPITEDRLKVVDPRRDAKLLHDMQRLAYETYLELNLCSLIRLDLRADANGKLYVLEANPKPDLKKPAAGITSLVSAGLPEVGMEYDDLILSLLADRLDFLFTHRRGAIRHLFDLMETPNLFDIMSSAESKLLNITPRESARSLAPDEPVALLNEITTDLNVLALNAAVRAAKASEFVANPGCAGEPSKARDLDCRDRLKNFAGPKRSAPAKRGVS